MGVVKLLNPVDTEYTFLSHQWQTPEHPWPDLLQVTEHLKYIRTPWIWADWCAATPPRRARPLLPPSRPVDRPSTSRTSRPQDELGFRDL